MPINICFHVCSRYLSLTEFFDYIKFTFNQTTFLYPVFDADYESEVIFLIRMNTKYSSQLWARMSGNDYHLLTFVVWPNF
jgi:hypothetical protein